MCLGTFLIIIFFGYMMQSITSVKVKPFVIQLKKGQDGCKRAQWPKELKEDQVHHIEFQEFLEENEKKTETEVRKHILRIGRFLGFVQTPLTGHSTRSCVGSLEVFVSLYVNGVHREIMKSRLFNPHFTWTEDMIESISLYAKFHLKKMQERVCMSEQLPSSNYKECIDQLVDDVTSGYTKSCADSREVSYQRKAYEDLKKLKKIDIASMQAAVVKGYKVLCKIWVEYGDRPLPKNIRGLANACLAGGIAWDTFPGRKQTWEDLLWEYVTDSLKNGQDFLLTSQHKTSKTYGSIAKYLTPSLKISFKIYAMLHHPEYCKTFIVPATEAAKKAPLPCCLRIASYSQQRL